MLSTLLDKENELNLIIEEQIILTKIDLGCSTTLGPLELKGSRIIHGQTLSYLPR